jgi:rhamnogalacturonan endolyase
MVTATYRKNARLMSHTEKRVGWAVSFAVALWPILATAQVNEKIDRGVVALTVSEDKVYVRWRLLKSDPEAVAFNVYRQDIGLGDFKKVNEKPIAGSTNFLDASASGGHGYRYKVTTVSKDAEQETLGQAYVFTLAGNQPWFSIKLTPTSRIRG